MPLLRSRLTFVDRRVEDRLPLGRPVLGLHVPQHLGTGLRQGHRVPFGLESVRDAGQSPPTPFHASRTGVGPNVLSSLQEEADECQEEG